jgi:hypothetical protein
LFVLRTWLATSHCLRNVSLRVAEEEATTMNFREPSTTGASTSDAQKVFNRSKAESIVGRKAEIVEGDEPHLSPTSPGAANVRRDVRYERKLEQAGVGAVSSNDDDDHSHSHSQEMQFSESRGTRSSIISPLPNSRGRSGGGSELYSSTADVASITDAEPHFVSAPPNYSVAYGEPIVAVAVDDTSMMQSPMKDEEEQDLEH